LAKKRFNRLEDHPVGQIGFTKRLLVGIPMTGILRSEWHLAYLSQVIPCNWAHSIHAHPMNQYSPLKFLVADARNLVAQNAVRNDFEWLFFLDHDVVLPHFAFKMLNDYMLKGDIPIMGGLYFIKAVPSEPLLYRGRGNSYYQDWKLGNKVWVDGMGLGCHLIHVSILKTMYEDSEEYTVQPGLKARRIFDSPAFHIEGEDGSGVMKCAGTEDLPWYERIIREKVFTRSGWPKFQRKKYPFLCDTKLFCKHIDFNGQQFPSQGEERAFLKNVDKNK
jgi:hypothetical protein